MNDRKKRCAVHVGCCPIFCRGTCSQFIYILSIYIALILLGGYSPFHRFTLKNIRKLMDLKNTEWYCFTLSLCHWSCCSSDCKLMYDVCKSLVNMLKKYSFYRQYVNLLVFHLWCSKWPLCEEGQLHLFKNSFYMLQAIPVVKLFFTFCHYLQMTTLASMFNLGK